MLYISSTAFPVDVLEGEADAQLAGIDGLELSGGHPYRPWDALVARLDALRDRGVSFLFHNYFPAPERGFVLNFATPDPDVLAASYALAEKALDLCARYGVPYYSLHPGYLSDAAELPDGQFAFNDATGGYAPALARFHANFGRLYAMARERGVRLALENLFMAPGRKTSINTTFDELTDILAPLPGDVLLLIDLGHLNIVARQLGFDRWDYVRAAVHRYSSRMAEIHLSGNEGVVDQHLPLAPGDWQLAALTEFADCSGALGKGVNVTIESRRLEPDVLRRVMRLTRDALGQADD